MIKNLWNNTKFYCAYRHDPIEMIIHDGPHSPFYSCPKYYPDAREEGEKACPNRLNFIDAEGLLEKFSEIVSENIKNDIYQDYTGLEFDYKAIHVKVLEFKQSGVLKLIILNKKALK